MKRKLVTILPLVVAVAGLLASNLKQPAVASVGQQEVNLDNPAVPFSRADTLLHVQDSQVKVNGEPLLSVGGKTGGYVIWFYSPRYGRYIFSTRPHPKYEFEEVQVLDGRRIVFSSAGKRFEWVLSAPLAERGTITRLWMMHDKHPEPLKERKDAGGEIGAATHYEYLLRNP
jgi:hypothetical protein